jgi:hypothetical protein
VIFPARHLREAHDDRRSAKVDRWVVGLLAGAALAYLLGRALGIGQPRRAESPRGPDAER